MIAQNKVKKVITWIVGIFIVFYFVIPAILSAFVGHKLGNEIERIKSNGDPITMEDLSADKIPRSQNGGVYYQKLVDPLINNGENEYSAVKKNQSDLEEMSWRYSQPDYKTDWKKASEDWEIVKGLILPIVEKGANSPSCRFLIKYQGAATCYPHYSVMRSLSRVVTAGALIEAHKGNEKEALRLVNLSFKISESMKDEPSYIALLVRIACIKIASQRLREITEVIPVHEANVESSGIYKTLHVIDLRPQESLAMKGERAIVYWSLTHEKLGDMVGDTNIKDPWMLFIGKVIYSYPARPILLWDQLTYLRFMEQRVEKAQVPYRDLVKLNLQRNPASRISVIHPLTKILANMYDCRLQAEVDSALAEIALNKVGLSLLAYKEKTGSFPQTLSILNNRVLPKDPFSKKELIYRKNGSGFILYSIGKNLRDDKGRVSIKPYNPEIGDIVWNYKGK